MLQSVKRVVVANQEHVTRGWSWWMVGDGSDGSCTCGLSQYLGPWSTMHQAVVLGVRVARQQACMCLGGFQQRGSTDMANDERVGSSDSD
jgi:hypothetical protein